MNTGRLALATAVVALAVTIGPVAHAQEQSLSIELNDAAPLESACRLVFVAVNKTGVVLDKTSYDVITFDATGKVGQSLAFQFGKLPVGKTKVVKFDLAAPGQRCIGVPRGRQGVGRLPRHADHLDAHQDRVRPVMRASRMIALRGRRP